MKPPLPNPTVVVVLLLAWLVLNDTLAPAHVLLGLLAGVAGAAALARLQPARRPVRRLAVPAMQLLGAVLVDIVQSNLAVARIALRIGRRPRVAGFLRIPLELDDPAGLAVLACIVTATPGTSWARYDAAAGVLTLHVLDLADDEAWVRSFKSRYERRLLEILG